MLQDLEEHLSKFNHTLSLQILTNKPFIAALTTPDINKLTKIVESAVPNINLTPSHKSFHPKIALAIYCTVIMTGYKQYSTKTAIQFLCKYYRFLENQQNQKNASHRLTLQTIANLLLRVPTFTNYKLIIKSLNPQLTPISLILEHRQKMKKQCNSQYEEYVVMNYKKKYPQIVTTPSQLISNTNKSIIGEDQENYQIISSQNNSHSLHKQLGELIKGPYFEMMSLFELEEGSTSNHESLYLQITQKSQKQKESMKYLINRIRCITREQIDIQQVFAIFEQILSKKPPLKDTLLISDFLKKIYQEIIIRTRNWVFQALTELVVKCKFSLIRKMGWIHRTINNTLLNFHNQYKHLDLVPIFTTIQTCYRVFGHGFWSFKHLLFTSEASVTTLLKSLCLNPHSDSKKENHQMNVQSKKKSQSSNKPILALSLNPSLVDTPFQFYLSERTDQSIRNDILVKCLDLLITYFSPKSNGYSEKNDHCQKDINNVSEIIAILQNSKNNLSQLVRERLDELIRVLFRGVGSAVQGEFWNFCSRTFDQMFRRKNKKSFTLEKMGDIYIEPTKKVKKERSDFSSLEVQISEPHLGHRNSFPQDNEIRKTKSFDMCLEGWQGNEANRHESSKKVTSKSVSEMFYSIKECSENDEKNQEKGEMEEQFILTPNFD